MPGAAAQIGDRRAGFGLLGKAGQQSPVQRLCGQLVAEDSMYSPATAS
jgi:hypothetical protein